MSINVSYQVSMCQQVNSLFSDHNNNTSQHVTLGTTVCTVCYLSFNNNKYMGPFMFTVCLNLIYTYKL